jgi:hemerythrin
MPERILQWKEEYSNDEEVYLQSKKILTPEHLLAHKKIIDILQNLIKKMRFNDQNMLERDLALFFQGYLTRHRHSLLINQESLSTSL